MNPQTDNMLSLTFYKYIMQSFIENPFWKLIAAALISLFAVPVEFMVAVPLFWCLDFGSGLYAAGQNGIAFSRDKLNAQYVKMGIHIAFLLGCTWLANLFDVKQFLTFGFGYIVATEFISTIRNLFSDRESVKLINRLKELLMKAIGLDSSLLDDEKKDEH